MTPEEFKSIVLKEFDFLIQEFGCSAEYPGPKYTDPTWAAGYDVWFVNATTRVEIELQVIEQLPVVRIGRRIPSPSERSCFPLGLLLIVRAPHLNPLKDIRRLPLSKSIETLLCEYAAALRAVGQDILEGDFDVFSQLSMEANRQMEKRTSESGEDFTYF